MEFSRLRDLAAKQLSDSRNATINWALVKHPRAASAVIRKLTGGGHKRSKTRRGRTEALRHDVEGGTDLAFRTPRTCGIEAANVAAGVVAARTNPATR